jgi:hypothetical protein
VALGGERLARVVAKRDLVAQLVHRQCAEGYQGGRPGK